MWGIDFSYSFDNGGCVMMRKIMLVIVCAACGIAANNEISAEDGVKFPIQISLYGGVRAIKGDDRPYMLGIIYSNGGTDVKSGDSFAKDAVGGGIALSTGNRVSEQRFNYIMDLDLSFGSSLLIIGAGFGAGYNVCFAADKVWMQGKATISYLRSYRELGDFPYNLIVNGTHIYDPSVDVVTSYISLLPEICGYMRLSTSVLGVVSVGYQLPILSSDISFVFSGEDYYGDVVTESIGSSSNNLLFFLDREKVKETKSMPKGIVVNIGIVLEI
jgi:hypothetical protein